MLNSKTNTGFILNNGATPLRTLTIAFFACLFFVSFYSCSKKEPAAPLPVTPNPVTPNKEIKFTVGNRSTLSQSMFPQSIAGYFTDGAVSVLKINDKYYAFWANFQTFRSISNSPLLENHINKLDPFTAVFGGRQPDNGSSNGFNDGGMWLIGVRQLADGRLAGFFHAESHWYPRTTQGWMAYKSIGVAYSTNNGLSWDNPTLILRNKNPKAQSPGWSGLGDGGVIFNHKNNKYYCFYTPAEGVTAISMASTDDPNGLVNWKKWHNGSFSEAGIDGKETPITPLSNNPGANPSVHWNTYLEKFVLIWHGWNGKIYISASPDCETWEKPQLLLEDGSKAWYPNIVGTESSVEGGQKVTLYYGYDFQAGGKRTLAYRTISFLPN